VIRYRCRCSVRHTQMRRKAVQPVVEAGVCAVCEDMLFAPGLGAGRVLGPAYIEPFLLIEICGMFERPTTASTRTQLGVVVGTSKYAGGGIGNA